MAHVFTVRELTQALRDVVEGNFPLVWVRGEIANLARPGSGHTYFTLKDAESVLSVVWFRQTREAARPGGIHPLTGEVCEAGPANLADGLSVLVAGRLTVYPPRGAYQLVAELVEEQGVGRLAVAFEALKRELAGLGYFDEERKMRVPHDPRRVVLITAPGGAAVRDFLRIASEGGAGAEIRILPVLVQGEQAPAQIARALDRAADEGWAEVVCLLRGGGSLEDLWAFNTREVADAVHRCTLPVVSGVGHEVDVTIADLVADRRAATPTHAAQGLWTPRRVLAQRLDEAVQALTATGGTFLAERERRYAELRRALYWLSPARTLERLAERFAELEQRLPRAANGFLAARAGAQEALAARLLRAFGPQETERREERLSVLSQRLARGTATWLSGREAALDGLATRLRAASPEAPLARGYGLVRVRRTGRFLRAPDDVAPGEMLDIRVQHGEVAAVVAPADDSGDEDTTGRES
ncbi:Exodeoxyribonuclease 7 large subunit [Desulfovibrio sp. X2]|uniref:exodeoxyribonuclease VII large subunit n=1 Tax=Desulfovibrio sp. X2 TaxID=941449 RepID=UPI0003587D33|nr:exodeoxyribonuclease VII large subunit [Desulfovibrio sp. X2]EPR37527.1 Exodeoxyribonuclease 7 large subunit [Desulfovibrio sp. X2]